MQRVWGNPFQVHTFLLGCPPTGLSSGASPSPKRVILWSLARLFMQARLFLPQGGRPWTGYSYEYPRWRVSQVVPLLSGKAEFTERLTEKLLL